MPQIRPQEHVAAPVEDFLAPAPLHGAPVRANLNLNLKLEEKYEKSSFMVVVVIVLVIVVVIVVVVGCFRLLLLPT